MSLEISNKLTELGIQYFFNKLFDPAVEYNQMFFSAPGVPLKLRIYQNDREYLRSTYESISVVDNSVFLEYKFNIVENSDSLTDSTGALDDTPKNEPDPLITDIAKIGGFGTTSIKSVKLVDLNESVILSIDGLDAQYLTSDSDYNRLGIISLKFNVGYIDPCIPNDALPLIAKALSDQSDDKITTMYLGTGVPDLSGNSSVLTNKLTEIPISDNFYFSGSDLVLKVTQKNSPLTSNNITELGLGIPLSDSDYILYIMREVNFESFNMDTDVVLMFTLKVV